MSTGASIRRSTSARASLSLSAKPLKVNGFDWEQAMNCITPRVSLHPCVLQIIVPLGTAGESLRRALGGEDSPSLLGGGAGREATTASFHRNSNPYPSNNVFTQATNFLPPRCPVARAFGSGALPHTDSQICLPLRASFLPNDTAGNVSIASRSTAGYLALVTMRSTPSGRKYVFPPSSLSEGKQPRRSRT